MTDKGFKSIANKFFDYMQSILPSIFQKCEFSGIPDVYAQDNLSIATYLSFVVEYALYPIVSAQEFSIFRTLLNCVAEITLNGSLHAPSIMQKLIKITKDLPRKRYFEISRRLNGLSSPGFMMSMVFSQTIEPFYFPDTICIGTDSEGKFVESSYTGKSYFKYATVFCMGVSYLVGRQSTEKLKRVGITDTKEIVQLLGYGVASQASCLGNKSSYELTRSDCGYLYGDPLFILQQIAEKDNVNNIYAAIYLVFNEEEDYLLNRTQIIQDRIVHIDYVGEIFGVTISLDKFYIHEVHNENVHQISFEYMKNGKLVYGTFGIHNAVIEDSYPYTEEALLIALWLRSQFSKDIPLKLHNVVRVELGKALQELQTYNLWYESPRAWTKHTSSNPKVRKEAKVQERCHKIVHIDPFIRKLNKGMYASASAQALAREYHLQIPLGYTLVTAFDRHYGKEG